MINFTACLCFTNFNFKNSFIFRIIHGDGQALYHYVNLHSSRGVIVCSLNSLNAESNSRYRSILNNFRLSAQKIHRVLSQKVCSVLIVAS